MGRTSVVSILVASYALVLGLLSADARAGVSLYFCASVTTPNTWDYTTTNWSQGSGVHPQVWIDGSDAFFQTGVKVPITVGVSGTIASVNSITFGVDGYTLDGGTITLTGSPNSGGYITTAGSCTSVINSILAGSVGLRAEGMGTLTLSGANSHTGDTAVDQGTLNLANQNALQNSTFTGGNGTLSFDANVSGHAFTFGGLGGQSTINLFDTAFNPVALSVGNNNQSTTFSGSINGSGSLTKVGSGTLTLNGGIAGAVSTVISSGTLALGNYGGLQYSTVNMDGGTLGFGTLPFPNLIVPLGGLTGVGALTLTDNSSQPVILLVGGNNQSTTYSGALSGNGSLTKTGSGTLTLSGANTFTGDTAVSAGTLNLANGNALQNSTFTGGNGTLSFDASVGGHAFTFGGLNVTNGLNLNLMDTAFNPVALSVGNNNQSTTFSGNISGPLGSSFKKVGSGTLTLSGAITPTVGTVISDGTLALGNLNALVGNTVNMDGGALGFGTMLVPTPVTLGGLTGVGALTLTNDSSQPVILSVGNNNQSTTYSGALGGSGSLTKIGSGTLTLSGANTYTGDTMVNQGGTLNLANQNAIQNSTFTGGYGTLSFDATVGGHAFTFGGLSGQYSFTLMDAASNPVALSVGNNNQSTTYSGYINGPLGSSFKKVGSGTLTLNGAITPTVGTIISDGTLALGNLNALVGNTVNMDGGALGFGTMLVPTPVTLGGLTGVGPLTLTNDSSQPVMLSVGGNNQSTTYSGALGGSGSLTKYGSGTLTLGGANSFTGDTAVNQGTLNLANGNALQNSTFTGGGGTLAFDPSVSSHEFTFGGLSITNGLNINLMDTAGNPVALSVGNNNQSTTFSGGIYGPTGSSLKKVGSGTLTLSGPISYTGTTTVGAGTLNVTGSLAKNGAGSVFVQSAGTSFGRGNPTITRSVAASGGYAGLGSTIKGSDFAVPSIAQILDGTASTATSVSMSWRNRSSNEQTQSGGGLISDILHFSDTGSDAYVLQMSYDEGALASIWPGKPESMVFLTSYDSTSAHWVNAVMSNMGNNALGGELAYQGSFAQFQNTYGDMLLGYIGAYGVDTTNDVAWAVLNHNSQFGVGAAVPEPSTVVLGFTGLVCLLLLAWRRRNPRRPCDHVLCLLPPQQDKNGD